MKYEEAQVLESVGFAVVQMLIRFGQEERTEFYEEEVGMLESYFALSGCFETRPEAQMDRVKICAQGLCLQLITPLERWQFQKTQCALLKLTQENTYFARLA